MKAPKQPKYPKSADYIRSLMESFMPLASQIDFAKNTKIKKVSLNQWYKGNRRPTLDNVYRLSISLGIPPLEIIRGIMTDKEIAEIEQFEKDNKVLVKPPLEKWFSDLVRSLVNPELPQSDRALIDHCLKSAFKETHQDIFEWIKKNEKIVSRTKKSKAA